MERPGVVISILACTAAVLGGVCFVGFGLWFAPGWANGWPFGWCPNFVWPLGMAFVSFIASLIACCGAGGAAGVALGLHARLWPPAGWYRLWPIAPVAVASVAGWEVFQAARAMAVAVWP